MASTFVKFTLQIFVYAIGLLLFFTLLLVKPQTLPSLLIRAAIISVCFFRPPLLSKILDDKFFILFDFLVLCLSAASLVWTHSEFPYLLYEYMLKFYSSCSVPLPAHYVGRNGHFIHRVFNP